MFTYTPNSDNCPATISVVDDGAQRSTANLRQPVEDVADRTAYLGARSRGIDALNWSSTAALSGGSNPYLLIAVPLAWDAAYGRWIGSANASSNLGAIQSTDGLTWSGLGSATAFGTNAATDGATGIAVRPTDGVALAVGTLSSASTTWTLDPVASSWSPASIGSFSNATIYNGTYYDGGTGGVFIFWGQSSATGPVWSTNGVSWTAATFSPPASFVNSPKGYCQSLGRILIFPGGTTVVSKYMISNDGQTWAQATMPTLAAGESVVGAAWDSTTGLYLLLTSTSTASNLWSSANGASGTFTLLKAFTHRAYDLATTRGEWLVTLSIGGKLRIAQCLDAFHWSLTNFSMQLPTTSFYTYLRSSGGQLVYWDQFINPGLSIQASMVVGPAPALVI